MVGQHDAISAASAASSASSTVSIPFTISRGAVSLSFFPGRGEFRSARLDWPERVGDLVAGQVELIAECWVRELRSTEPRTGTACHSQDGAR
jgi:hypothetical protein